MAASPSSRFCRIAPCMAVAPSHGILEDCLVDGVERLVWWSPSNKGWYMDNMSANVMHTPMPKVFKTKTKKEKTITTVMKTPKPKHKLFKNMLLGTEKLFKVAR